METIKHFLENARATLTNLRALGIFAGLYALLLVTFYIFIATRVATFWQVLITYAFLVLMPAEFFVLQSAIVQHVRTGTFSWRQIVRGAIKLFIATVPIVVIALVFWALLDKFQLHYPAPKAALAESLRGAPKPQPLHWPTVIFATIRFLVFAIALPLATIHLWARVSAGDVRTLFSGGAEATVKRIGRWLARAFASDSVLIYALGAILFAFIPYAVIFVPISPKGTKTDFAVFIARLLIAFCFSLIGWILTVTAVSKLNPQASIANVLQRAPNTTAEAPA
jgi:hypothetical protein